MAGPSNPQLPSVDNYDVFLSFRGPDICYRFVSDLYHSLKSIEIRVFFYDFKLTPGERLDEELLRRIDNSRIYIPVLSETYASSKLCLRELTRMVRNYKESKSEGNKVILPVFYRVATDDVKLKTDLYKNQLAAHETIEEVEEWKKALQCITELRGWELPSTSRISYAPLIRLILVKVWTILKGSRSDLLSNNLVGIDYRLESVMDKLDFDANDVRMVGIHGMGGIGKTTLAKVVYNRISDKFGGCCFLENVRDTSSRLGLKHLQCRLVEDILGYEHRDGVDIKDSLQHRLRNKKVLIVLDDVDDARQIAELAGNLDWFGLGSRIIVTTRNTAVLPKVDGVLECEVKELGEHDAFLLFCKNAFQQDSPPPDSSVALCRDIVKATGGLPLSVKSIGSYLLASEDTVWSEALESLKRESGIQDRLMISYNILDDNLKQMFLDMACFFVGSNATIPAHMWRHCNIFSEAGTEVLSLMSIIKIGDDKKIWVHDHFRDLAKQVVHKENIGKPGERSRLWGQDAVKVLKTKKGNRKVQAIRLDCEMGSEPYVIKGDEFKGLVNLRYLDLGNAIIRLPILYRDFQDQPLTRLLCWLGVCCWQLSKITWLGWHGNTEFYVPSSLGVKNLVVLDLSKSAVNETWSVWRLLEEAKNLEVLDFTGCYHLTRTPDFSSFPRMERLVFRDCTKLEMIDPSVGQLRKLVSLDVRNCLMLKTLPNELGSLEQLHELLLDESSIKEIPNLGGLTNLETFSAKSCKSLHRLPKSIGSLVKVLKLLLDNCESLVEIPATIGQLDSLQELNLSHTRVLDLPDPIEKWSNLEVLNIDYCPIRNLPSSLGKLTKLEVLNVSGCLNLKGELPFSFEHLTSLRILRLDHTNISSLPATICGLSHLHTLDLEGCMKLQSLPELPVSLFNLKVAVTSSVVVPNLQELINLKRIELQHHSSSCIFEHPKSKVPSSSSSDLTQQVACEYEVFLSFRGPDTRRNFTSILHDMLSREHVNTFIDSEGLHVGDKIDKLLEIINQSKISIPIVSKGYADSKWCLKEAAEIVKCVNGGRQRVYPIFFDVNPDEVKNQTGDYEKAFKKHVDSGEFDEKTIQEWRDALREIESRKWLQLKASPHPNRSDGEPSYMGTELRKVVSDILNKLEKLPQLKVVDDLVGVEDHIVEITRRLDADVNHVKMLGIWGIPGIGKTTIAKCIFNQFASQFKHHSSLENVRGTSFESGSLLNFRKQLLFDISKSKMDFASSITEISTLETRLKGKQVLILVDDVDTREQLHCLVGERDWFGIGSIIIVTTRKEEVVRDSKVWSNYEVKPMHPHNAFQLFCKHAFQQESPLAEFNDLSWDIVDATGRHPLALETMGRYLHSEKDKKVWQGATNILKTMEEIHDKLRITYEALSPVQQQIFLDIACLFQGADKRLPIHMWNAQNFQAENALETLRGRGLIKFRDGNILWMHDLFIELGQEIVHRESGLVVGHQTRLWSSKDAMKVLKRKIGTKKVKAIHLDCGSESEKCCFRHENFEKLSKLEFLCLGDASLDRNSNFKGCLSSLIWISWRNVLDIPSGLHLVSLVILDLSKSMIKDVWDGWNSIKEAVGLEVLNLSSCQELTKTPDFSSFPIMKRLILEDCQGLVEIGPSISNLKALEFLDVRNCPNLKKLPEELGHLAALEELLLDGSSIQILPLSRDMKNLEIISAKSCGSLTKIPPAIWELQSLKKLDLSRTGVVHLHDSIENLTKLEVLNIKHCLILELPRWLWKLSHLKVLNASGCRNLKGDIPSGLRDLKILEVLRLDRTCVTSIPQSITELPLLRILDLKDCMKLQSLPALPSSLVELKVTLTSSEIEPNLQDLVNLKELEIVYCGELSKELMYLDKFPKIEKLAISKRYAEGL